MPGPAVDERLLALLGLARRAGKLAVGISAVEHLVHSGARPVVVIAAGIGPAQRRKILALRPVRGVIDGRIDRAMLAQRLGRDELVVVAVADPGFVAGLQELGLVRDIPSGPGA